MNDDIIIARMTKTVVVLCLAFVAIVWVAVLAALGVYGG